MLPERHVESNPTAAPAPAAPVVVKTRRGPVECALFGEGPAVLCLHGAMGGHDQASILGRTIGPAGYRYVAPSRPGYLGTALRLGRTPSEQAALYRDLLDALGIGRAAVMAVSGGGPSALTFALEHPDRCAALVIVSSIHRTVEQRLPLAWYVLKLSARVPWLMRAMQRKAAQDPAASARRSIRDPATCARTLADPEAGPLLRELLASTLDRMAARLPGTENDVALTRRALAIPVHGIRAPTLVVHGTVDQAAPFEQGREVAARVPGAELLAIEGGEHVAIFTHRDEVRARVEALLRANHGR